MITKEQALEFIYQLSKKHQVCLDLSKGFLGIDPFNCINNDIDYKCITRGSTEIEELVEYFIKSYSVADEVDKVPVDIDMLEVGKKYEVAWQAGWNFNKFTSTFVGSDNDICIFENTEMPKDNLKQIYRINKEKGD